jgi:hypothetical protein
MYNELSTTATHRLMIRTEMINGDVYWTNGYTFEGYIWGVNNPKVNRIIQTHHGDRFKTINLGTDFDHRGRQVACIYAIPWDKG